jgi:hypothetical protein
MQTLIQKFSTGFGFLGLMLLGFEGAALAADGDACTAISSVPFTISLPGTYCVTKELSTPSTFTSGVAITVKSNDVTIDLSGHTLSNLAAGTGTLAVGIQGMPTGSNFQNITVRNGTVRGFYKGVSLTGPSGTTANSSGHLVENIRADFNRFVGIELLGAGSVARQNQILHTGGGSMSTQGFTGGLYIAGNGAQALDNGLVDTVQSLSTDIALGIVISAFPDNCTGMVIEGNRISNVTISPNSYAITTGAGTYSILIVNNRMANFDTGIVINNTGKYRDNLAINVTTPYTTNGTNAGNNE